MINMEYRQLGASDIEVSVVGLGCWVLGHSLSHTDNGRGSIPQIMELTAAVRYAVERGINHFDNSSAFDDGQAEMLLADILKTLGIPNTQVVISTKVGYAPSPTGVHPYATSEIRRLVERSLKNLHRDYVDILYLHHTDSDANDERLAEAAQTFDTLVAEGKVRLKGQVALSEAGFLKTLPVAASTGGAKLGEYPG